MLREGVCCCEGGGFVCVFDSFGCVCVLDLLLIVGLIGARTTRCDGITGPMTNPKIIGLLTRQGVCLFVWLGLGL